MADPERTIRVHAIHDAQIERLVERMAALTGEQPGKVRRAVEQSILTRGIVALTKELG